MAKIQRKEAKIFGSTAGVNEIAEFGSFAAASPTFTTDPDVIQALSNYLEGWFGAVVGANSPAIEDMNALCYLYAYQIAYVMQAGVAEWLSTTTYYIGSFANSAGVLYVSLTDNNTGNAVTDTTNWRPFTSSPRVTPFDPAVSSPKTLVAADNGATFLVNTANGASQFNLPAASLNYRFTIKDSAGSAQTNAITIHRVAAESIEGVASDYVCNAPWGEWVFVSDGTNWFIL